MMVRERKKRETQNNLLDGGVKSRATVILHNKNLKNFLDHLQYLEFPKTLIHEDNVRYAITEHSVHLGLLSFPFLHSTYAV